MYTVRYRFSDGARRKNATIANYRFTTNIYTTSIPDGMLIYAEIYSYFLETRAAG